MPTPTSAFPPTQLAHYVRPVPDIASWRQRLFHNPHPDGTVVHLDPAQHDELWPWLSNAWHKTGNTGLVPGPDHAADWRWERWCEYRCYHWHGFRKKYQGKHGRDGAKTRSRGAACRLGCEHAKAKVVKEFHYAVDHAGHTVEVPVSYKIHLTGYHASADGKPHLLADVDALGHPKALRSAHKRWCEAFDFKPSVLKKLRLQDQESTAFLRPYGHVKPFTTKDIDNDCKKLKPRLADGPDRACQGGDAVAQVGQDCEGEEAQRSEAGSEVDPRRPPLTVRAICATEHV